MTNILRSMLHTLPLILSLAVGAEEQGTQTGCVLRGRVVDGSGQGLARAEIVATPGGTVAVRPDGGFCLADPPGDGDLTLVVSMAGYASEKRELQLSPEGRAGELEVVLLPGRLEDEMVVTGTRTRRLLEDVPVRTEIVDKELMQAIASRTLADAVEYTTGVRVESNCQNCNFSQIRLLGLEGAYTQILMDGQPMISSLAQVYGIEQIPARMIDRVEIVKGGGSALYGSGAVGGVVNVISREPVRISGALESRADSSGGEAGYSQSGSLDWVSEDQLANALGYFQVDQVEPLDLTDDGYTEVSLRKLRVGGGRASRYLLGGDAKLTGELTVMEEIRRGGDRLDLPPQEATIAEWIDTRRIGASATWSHSVSPAMDYSFTLGAADTHRDSYYGTGQDPNAFGVTDNLLIVADSQVNRYAGRHTLTWGGQATWEDLRDEQPGYGRFTDDLYRNVGLFLQDSWAFASGWEMVYGLRADKHSTVDRIIASPRLALRFSPAPNLNVRASVASGFRAPQAFDEDLHLSSVGGEVRFIRLSEDLREERSTNYLLGAEWRPRAGSGQALFEINGFYTGLSDLFLSRDDDDPATEAIEFLKVNHGDARIYGVELNSGWGIGDDLIVQGGVVLQRARYGEPEPDFGSRDFFRTPEIYGNLTLTVKAFEPVTLFAGLRYTGPVKAPHYAGYIAADRLETTPSFLTLDASIAFPLYAAGTRRLTLTLAGRNLTDEYQEDLDQGPLRDANYVYGPRFPRSVSLGLRLEL